MPNWTEVQADPDYQALVRSDPERAKQFRLDYAKSHITSDPDFQKLAPERKTAFVRDFVHGPETPGEDARSITRRVAGAAGGMVNPLPALEAALSPIETAKGLAAAHGEQFGKAREAYDRGDMISALGRLGAGSVPLLGPAAADIGETFGRGEIPEGAGKLAGLAAPGIISRLASKLRVYKPKSYLEPRQTTGVQEALRRGVPVDLEQATGSPVLAGQKAAASRLPFAGGLMANKLNEQQIILRTAMDEISRENVVGAQTGRPPLRMAPASPFKAAEDARANIWKTVATQRDEAHRAHATIAQMATANTKKVLVGYEDQPITGPYGEPLGTVKVPVHKDIAAPVDYKAVKADIAPVLEQMEAVIPAAEKSYSPGLTLLRQISQREDFVPLEAALDDLSELKAQSRTFVPHARGKSQGKAAFGVSKLQPEIDAALKDLGPTAQAAYQQRNAATVLKKNAEAIAAPMTKAGKRDVEPAKVYRRLTAPEDLNIFSLQEAVKGRPDLGAELGRAFFDDLRSDVGDGVAQWRGANQKYKKLGPQTRQVLFGQNEKSIGAILEFAEMTQKTPNPSGTGSVVSPITTGQWLVKDPVRGSVYLLANRQFIKAITADGGADVILNGLRLPLTDPNASLISKTILANAGLQEGQERRPQP